MRILQYTFVRVSPTQVEIFNQQGRRVEDEKKLEDAINILRDAQPRVNASVKTREETIVLRRNDSTSAWLAIAKDKAQSFSELNIDLASGRWFLEIWKDATN